MRLKPMSLSVNFNLNLKLVCQNGYELFHDILVTVPVLVIRLDTGLEPTKNGTSQAGKIGVNTCQANKCPMRNSDCGEEGSR